MIVKAKYNHIKDLPLELQHFAYHQEAGSDLLPLTIGKQYVVAGIRKIENTMSYLIVADYGELRATPWWYPEHLFVVVDSNKPSGWVESGDPNGDSYIFTFPELALDETGDFENNLEDGEPEELGIFRKYYRRYREQA